MARRSDHSREEIRDMALAAAESIVTEQGASGLTARKVASEIGYTVGTLYLVFQNQDDLILQLNARALDELFKKMQKTMNNCPAPLDCILKLGHTYIDYASKHSNRWGLIYEHRPSGDTDIPDWYRDKVAMNLGLVEVPLRELAPDQSPKDIHQAARALWSGVHGICILSLTEKLDVTGVKSVRALADMLIGNFLHGFTQPAE